MNNDTKFVISRYNENYDWIHKYSHNYVVYNKGEPILDDERVVNIENIGHNIKDIPRFICEYYNKLPDVIVFLQANPFDHCKKEFFDIIMNNDFLTCVEYHGDVPANSYEERTEDGGYLELNNSWYISAHNETHGIKCNYKSFDEFMFKYFQNYVHVDWIRFAPGAQYIIRKEHALAYPKQFWLYLFDELYENNMTEAHIVERSFWMIFQGNLKLRDGWEK